MKEVDAGLDWSDISLPSQCLTNAWLATMIYEQSLKCGTIGLEAIIWGAVTQQMVFSCSDLYI